MRPSIAVPQSSILQRAFAISHEGAAAGRERCRAGAGVQLALVWQARAAADRLEITQWRGYSHPRQVAGIGDHVHTHLRAEQKRWDEGVGYLERETFEAFLKLPAQQRKLIREIILTFAKVHSDTAPVTDPSSA
jgi:hypothetical protein